MGKVAFEMCLKAHAWECGDKEPVRGRLPGRRKLLHRGVKTGGHVLAVARSIEKYIWREKQMIPSLNARAWWTMGSH